MLIENETIQKAKEKLGDRNAELIAEIMEIEDYNPSRKVGRCPNPNHNDSTPSCSYNPKTHSFHCFGCGYTVDLIDAIMLKKNKTFNQACEEVFNEASISYDFTECGLLSKPSYRYPKPQYADNKDQVYEYWGSRMISKETIDYLDIEQDIHGNTLFQYRDLNDVFVMCKVRKSHKVDKKDGPKCWYLPDSDVTHILFNMNKINTSQPLIITTGEGDCAAAIECGFYNTVSIGGGDQNTMWIGECWDWLQEFSEIILVHDNDDSGKKYVKDVSARLGEYRIKVVEIPVAHENEDGTRRKIKDLNELLFLEGKDKVREVINSAKDREIPTVVDYTKIAMFDMSDVEGVTTGIPELDTVVDKFYVGTTTVLTGIAGCVDCDTEYFNGTEWKRIADFEPGEKVLQYNPDGTAELVTPEYYYKVPCEEFWDIHFTAGVHQCVSDDHNLVYITSKGNLFKKKAKEFCEDYNSSGTGMTSSRFITTFKYNGTGINLTDDEIRLMCAVICDGSFSRNTHWCRVNVKKEKKKKRMNELLTKMGVEYYEKKYNPHDLEYSTFLFNAPLRVKEFPVEWYNATSEQFQIIMDEVTFWDGSTDGSRTSFSSNVKHNADFIQFVYTVCGYRSKLSAYDRRGQTRGKYVRKSIDYNVGATIRNLIAFQGGGKHGPLKKIKASDGYKYCFTVPSGMLVLRKGGDINVTGNSGKSSFLSTIACKSMEQGFPAFIYSGELPNVALKNWIDCVQAGQRNLNQYINPDGKAYYKLKYEAYKKINEFYKGKMFIYKDGFEQQTSRLLETMEGVVRKYGVRTLIIDNMTSVDLENDDNNKYVKQDAFIRDLIEFAKKWQVIMFIVLHPKKMDMVRRMSLFDLQGCVSAVNLAHRVISLYRVQPKDHQGVMGRNGNYTTLPIKYDVILDILKDRYGSAAGKNIGLYYDYPSKRFFSNRENLDHQYAWDTTDYGDSPLPFGCPQLDAEDEVFGPEIKGGQSY